ncbi:MAG: hypothetical protein CL691_01850 [Cellvibrionales bacterium]|nr:hypothetical protein [Cellvibrionales bacterium]|tara:strand:- start:7475 stop:8791 length:1317 start_codon:yes stop_codon:yes gene_type:complete
MQFNSSLRLIASFTVNDPCESGCCVSHHDFAFNRYPELKEIVLSVAENALARVDLPIFDKTLIDAFTDLDIAKIANVGQEQTIHFNEHLDVNLTILARFAGQPSSRKSLNLVTNPSLATWIMSNYLANEADFSLLNPKNLDELKFLGVLVDQQPPSIVFYPPLEESDWQEQIVTAERLYLQVENNPIPEPMLKLLGTKIPEVPNTNIIWGCEAGSRLPFATVVPKKEIDQFDLSSESIINKELVKKQKTQWKQKIDLARVKFKRHAYAKIEDIISSKQQLTLQRHMRELVSHHYFGPLNDGQVERRMGIHNESVTAALHLRLTKLVSLITGEDLKPSYAYLGCYLDGAELKPHTDRPQCQFNLSIVFDMSDEQGQIPQPWPIFLKKNNKTTAVNLAIGSGLLYQGTELEHWREPLPKGQRAIVCFYHFVEKTFTGSTV